MSRAYLRAGASLQVDAQPYRIERQCRDGTWVLRNLKTERALELSTESIYGAYAENRLVFDLPPLRRLVDARQRRTPQLPPNLDDKQLQAAQMRLAYVRAAQGIPATRSKLEAVIDDVWQATAQPRPPKPSWTSVYRWSRAYRATQSPASLVAATSDRGNRRPRFPIDVEHICEEVIDDVYLTLERPTVEHALNVSKARVRQENRLRSSVEQLPLPSRKLLERMLAQIPERDRYRARHGFEATRRRYRSALHQRQTEAPLERAEMDHTRMNVFVVDDETGIPLGRPWLTILIDDFTRVVLGYCISFEPPSRATVAKCLRHAFMPKVDLHQRFPDLEHDWEPHGVVAELVVDGGVEFHSDELQGVCFELNIEQHFSPRKTPWFKGKVERFMGTVNRGTTIVAPGKTFDGIVEREDYDPKQHAVLTMSTLEHIVVKWVVDVYHQKPHRTLHCSPMEMWRQHIQPEDIGLMHDPMRFDAILGGAAQRVLTHKGIEFAGLSYNSPDLANFRRTYGARLNVEIRYDRSDLGSIIVLHPESRMPYRVPCLRPDYAQGLTEWQHEVCKRYARRLGRGNDVDAWVDALLVISELVSKELKLGRKKSRGGDRLARWRDASRQSIGSTRKSTEWSALPPVASEEDPAVLSRTARGRTPEWQLADESPAATTMQIQRRRFEPVIQDRRLSPDQWDEGDDE